MIFLPSRESEGVFQYGNYRREADDLRAVILHLIAQNRKIAAIAGHSKGVLLAIPISKLTLHISRKNQKKREKLPQLFLLRIGIQSCRHANFLLQVAT